MMWSFALKQLLCNNKCQDIHVFQFMYDPTSNCLHYQGISLVNPLAANDMNDDFVVHLSYLIGMYMFMSTNVS